MTIKHYYLVHIQYCGNRFHGWAKQPDVKTIHMMIDKTLGFVFGNSKFRSLGSSKTDAMVSANHYIFELFLEEPLDEETFMEGFNFNLPADIRATKVEAVDSKFNIIQSPKLKDYIYLFAHGEKHHPFAAPLMSLFPFKLDIELMKEGAALFKGKHNFRKYCTKPSQDVDFYRELYLSEIIVNDRFNANFFPKESFIFHVQGKGFMHHQIRLIMGQLVLLGKGEITLDHIKKLFQNPNSTPLDYIAPASGLILDRVEFEK